VVEGVRKDIVGRYQGKYDYGDGRVEDYSNSILMKFWRITPPFPQKPRCLVLTENIRWGYIPADTDVKKTCAVNREDLWRSGKTLGAADSEFQESFSWR